MEPRAPHTPVMLQEVLEWLRIKPDGVYVDATLGAGGHSEAIAERLFSGRLISLDRDEQALEIARERLTRFGSKVNCVLSPFSRIAEAVHELGIPKVDGVLADLGVSSMQLDQSERGFSFRGPRHNESRGAVRRFDVPLEGRPDREGSVSRSGEARDAEDTDETCSAAQ